MRIKTAIFVCLAIILFSNICHASDLGQPNKKRSSPSSGKKNDKSSATKKYRNEVHPGRNRDTIIRDDLMGVHEPVLSVSSRKQSDSSSSDVFQESKAKDKEKPSFSRFNGSPLLGSSSVPVGKKFEKEEQPLKFQSSKSEGDAESSIRKFDHLFPPSFSARITDWLEDMPPDQTAIPKTVQELVLKFSEQFTQLVSKLKEGPPDSIFFNRAARKRGIDREDLHHQNVVDKLHTLQDNVDSAIRKSKPGSHARFYLEHFITQVNALIHLRDMHSVTPTIFLDAMSMFRDNLNSLNTRLAQFTFWPLYLHEMDKKTNELKPEYPMKALGAFFKTRREDVANLKQWGDRAGIQPYLTFYIGLIVLDCHPVYAEFFQHHMNFIKMTDAMLHFTWDTIGEKLNAMASQMDGGSVVIQDNFLAMADKYLALINRILHNQNDDQSDDSSEGLSLDGQESSSFSAESGPSVENKRPRKKKKVKRKGKSETPSISDDIEIVSNASPLADSSEFGVIDKQKSNAESKE